MFFLLNNPNAKYGRLLEVAPFGDSDTPLEPGHITGAASRPETQEAEPPTG